MSSVAPQKRPDSGSGAGKAAIIAAAVLVAAPLATQFEGYRGKAYYDPAHILTVCYGETQGVDPTRIYSKDECAAKLRRRMASDYAPAILKCLPELGDLQRRYVFGALLDASYNAGPKAVCSSRMATAIHAGDWAGGCAGFKGWYVTARDRKTGVRKTLPGLLKRRVAEAATCATIVATQAAPRPPAPTAAPLTMWQRIDRFFSKLFGG
jgi:lysozyme